jgi:hypothetical protein
MLKDKPLLILLVIQGLAQLGAALLQFTRNDPVNGALLLLGSVVVFRLLVVLRR